MPDRRAFLLALTFAPLVMSAQSVAPSPRDLVALHEQVRVQEITTRTFTQSDLIGWLAPVVKAGVVAIEQVGSSGEGRPITLYTYGTGPTATMALVDLMALFHRRPNDPLVKLVRERLTLLMIPMLNPDGAERFIRRTAQRIDMNRDAMALVTPEARTLKGVRDRFNPEFGFNLHDQDPRYTVGTTGRLTAIALLAPPVDESRSENDVRRRAKHVAAGIATTLEELIPGTIAKWDDTFEPRAFGDNVQRWGTSTVLIESGGWPGDKQKMHLRAMNFVALLDAFRRLADGSWSATDVSVYESLAFNMRLGCDILITNASIRPSQKAPAARVDVAVNIDTVSDNGDTPTIRATVVDIGDLRTYTAYETHDAGGVEVDSLVVKVDKVLTLEQLKSLIPRK
jgi:hypothetical protein